MRNEYPQPDPPFPNPGPLLDGAWFRREREHLAIGRRTVAGHLGIPESRIATLEHRKLPVPSPWLPLVAALGFRLPGEPQAPPPEDANTEPAAAPVESTPGGDPVAAPSPHTDEFAQTHTKGTDTEMPSSGAPVMPPELIAPPQDKPPPLPELPRGGWLRERRYALGLLQRETSIALRVPVWQLCLVEAHNLPVLPSWLPALGALKFYMASGGDRSAPRKRLLTGKWLKHQRREHHLSANAVSVHLGIQLSLLRRIESSRLPLPPEWLPSLRKLARTPPPAAPLSPPPNLPETLSGASLRHNRERIGLTQKALSDHLRMSQTHLCHVEREDRAIQPRWLPILQKLGFPVPASLQAGRGAWLQAERERMAPRKKTGVTQPAQRLDVLRDLIKRVEPTSPSPLRTAEAHAMVETVVSYRLKLGRYSGQSAADLMTSVGNDLRQAGLEHAIPFEEIEAALTKLLHPRQKGRTAANSG